MIVAFTGHRPEKINHRINEVSAAIQAVLMELKPEKVISGMARGVDMLAAGWARALHIPYVAAIPFLSNHSAEDRRSWQRLVDDAAEVKVVCEGDYAVWKFQKRNEWMVDNCELLIAVYDGSRGGTKNCIDYADKAGRVVRYLDVWG